MSNFATPFNYPAVQGAEEVPQSLLPATLKEFNNVKNVVKYVQTTSGTVGQSSTLLFNIAGGMSCGSIKQGSVYLKCTITVAIPSTTTADTLLWAGGQPYTASAPTASATATSTVNNQIAGASSIIDRMVVNLNGVQASILQNYNKYRDMAIAHATTQNFVADLLQLEFAGMKKQFALGSAVNYVMDVAIPIFNPVFNSSICLPLYLLNNLTVEITTSTIANALKMVKTADGTDPTSSDYPTSYTVSNAQLVWEEIQLSNEFKQAMRDKLLSSGGAYKMPIEDVYSLSVGVPTSSVTDYVVGLSLSSLKAVLWTEILSANTNSIGLGNSYFYNGLSDAKLYVDNQLVNNVLIDSDTVAFAEMNKAIGRLNDYNISSVIANTTNIDVGTATKRNNYLSDVFLGGISTTSISDFGFSKTGRPCSQVQLHLEHYTTTASTYASKWQGGVASTAPTTLYIWFLYDSTILIDGMGNVAVSR